MIKLEKANKAWGTEQFNRICQQEIAGLDKDLLPLQQGLTQTSCVGIGDIDAVILDSSADKRSILVRASLFYSGIIAGSCCADDPTPVEELPEHCELEFIIDRSTSQTKVRLVD